MSNSLSNKTWLDDDAKTQVNEKIKEIIITTDFPEFVKNEDLFMEYYKDFPNMTSNFDENFVNVKSFVFKKLLETLWKKNNRKQWDIERNTPVMTLSPNYVAASNKVAFRVDVRGNLNMTWSVESLAEYSKRVQCLVDQYESYDIEGDKKKYFILIL
ncbi:endothelin-converting enzyme homolog [Centruroides vittatus]|uniref:endothelin-converting enzyme homolog n=1 Tax=Centruroides vittatus TaxID=120091 RepID=UPI00350F56B3